MAHVFILDSNNEDTFFCGPCKKVFNSLNLFLTHKNNDCKNESFINTRQEEHVFIESSSPAPETYATEHIKSDQEKWEKEMICKTCKKKFKKLKTLQVHLKMHDQNPYQCLICGRCFIQKSHLQRHVMSHRVWPDSLSETTAKSIDVDLSSYSCKYCDSVLSNYNQFRAHLKCHLSVKKYKCIQNHCNNLYDTVESLMHHVSNTHKTITYTCYNCNKVFHSLDEVAAHYQSNNNTCVPGPPHLELFKCSQCDAVFRKAEKLSLHMLTESHKKTCIYCNKNFSSDKRLRIHLQIHKKLKPYQCNICSQSFNMKKYLSSHILKHGESKFSCIVCKGLFKRQDSLQRHMKSHQIRKIFTCPFKDTLECNKEFTRSDKLKSHVKFHTKKMTLNSKTSQHYDTGTVEICIVPLDSKNKE